MNAPVSFAEQIDRLKLPLKVIHIAQILNGGPFAQESEIRSQ